MATFYLVSSTKHGEYVQSVSFTANSEVSFLTKLARHGLTVNFKRDKMFDVYYTLGNSDNVRVARITAIHSSYIPHKFNSQFTGKIKYIHCRGQRLTWVEQLCINRYGMLCVSAISEVGQVMTLEECNFELASNITQTNANNLVYRVIGNLQYVNDYIDGLKLLKFIFVS